MTDRSRMKNKTDERQENSDKDIPWYDSDVMTGVFSCISVSIQLVVLEKISQKLHYNSLILIDKKSDMWYTQKNRIIKTILFCMSLYMRKCTGRCIG